MVIGLWFVAMVLVDIFFFIGNFLPDPHHTHDLRPGGFIAGLIFIPVFGIIMDNVIEFIIKD